MAVCLQVRQVMCCTCYLKVETYMICATCWARYEHTARGTIEVATPIVWYHRAMLSEDSALDTNLMATEAMAIKRADTRVFTTPVAKSINPKP